MGIEQKRDDGRTTIPEDVGTIIQAAFDLDERPRELQDWLDAVAESSDLDIDLDTLCTAEASCCSAEGVEDSRHRARPDGGDWQAHCCVLNAIAVPNIAENAGSVHVRSESPVSGAVVDLRIDEDGIAVDPDGAVMSLGMTMSATGPDENRFCPYCNAFVDRTEYEQWAGETDAVTMGVPIEEAPRLARALG